jgi:UDP-N-acetylmuramate dehydrogenase
MRPESRWRDGGSEPAFMPATDRSDTVMTAVLTVEGLREMLGREVRDRVPLAPYTAARIGGPAEFLVTAETSDQLATIISRLWQEGIEFFVLGGGSNVLVSDSGLQGVTVINRAKAVRFHDGNPPSVRAESGVVFSNLANRCALKGLSGLEWAGTVPGTVGGAVYGNAGAFGGDTAGSLIWAEVLTATGREKWPAASMGYGYRTSALKRRSSRAVVLSAELRLERSTRAAVTAQMAALTERRRATQPPGASMGSMFKNPEADKAGRLIEAAGLKGRRVGNIEISREHANFFVNHGQARATDVRALIDLARNTVKEKFGVELELEIELLGE